MAPTTVIHPKLTLRQVVSIWPDSAGVLGRYGAAPTDGRLSLQELGAFAAARGVPLDSLLHELHEATGAPTEPTPPKESDRQSSPVMPLATAVLIALTLGATWGVWLLLTISFRGRYEAASPASVHVHGVAQLWGWVGLFIFGIATHVLRQSTKTPPPRWLEHAAVLLVACGLLIFAIGLLDQRIAAWGNVAGSACLSLAALAFSTSIARSLLGRGQRPLVWHAFVLTGCAWLLCWAASDLWLRIHYRNTDVLPDPARQWLIAVPVLGFITNMIFGFGIRFIPGLLNITKPRHAAWRAAAVTYNLALPALLLGPPALAAAAAAVMLAASMLYLHGMRWLRSQPSRPIYGIDPRGNHLIRVAYFWLIVGLGMIAGQNAWAAAGRPVHHAFQGAWRHALTVGFITTMILGVGFRTVPVFLRRPLWSNRMMLASGLLIVVGNAWRVSLELLTIGPWQWPYRAMGVSGLLELTAIALFGIDQMMTGRAGRLPYQADEPLTPRTRVREAVNARPDLEHRLRTLGIDMFDDSPFIAPSMTFGALALATGWDEEALVTALDAR